MCFYFLESKIENYKSQLTFATLEHYKKHLSHKLINHQTCCHFWKGMTGDVMTLSNLTLYSVFQGLEQNITFEKVSS